MASKHNGASKRSRVHNREPRCYGHAAERPANQGTHFMARTKRVTLRQVAEHAKVSPMTVSNFVNGRFDLMTPEMREKVGQSVKALNYRRNFGAHLLRTSKHWSIGIIVVDASDQYLSDGYTTQIIAGVSNTLNANGFSVMLQGVKPDAFETSNMLTNLQTDGLCVLLSGSEVQRARQFEAIEGLQQPTVLFLEAFEQKSDLLCSVMQDDEAAARRLARRVLARGPKSVLIVTSGENEWAAVNRRVAGITGEIDSARNSGGAGYHHRRRWSSARCDPGVGSLCGRKWVSLGHHGHQ